MAPILIDTRGLIKLGLVSLLTLIVIFAAGFFSGYQKATMHSTTISKTEILVLPEQSVLGISDIEPQIPGVISAGEAIDVDRPKISLKVEPSNDNKKSEQNNIAAAVSKQTEKSKIDAPIDVSSVTPETMASSVKKNETVKTNRVKNNNDSVPENNTESFVFIPIAVSALSVDELNKIKYSVQVGMYGNLANADNMKKMLQAQQFDAYVSDYTNKKNETRYNVRFGYYADKKTAISELERYKTTKNGDGYLVNFSVSNIVNLADAKTINKDDPQKELNDKSDGNG